MKLTSLSVGSALFGAVLSLSSSHAFGAVDGLLSASSSGSLNIILSTEDRIKISGLSDIYLARRAATGFYAGGSSACVYRNSGTAYNLIATGSGSSGSFLLTDGGVNTVPYDIFYNDGVEARKLISGQVKTGFGNAKSSPDCAGQNNGYIYASVTPENIDSLPAGTYSGTLTLVVSPE